MRPTPSTWPLTMGWTAAWQAPRAAARVSPPLPPRPGRPRPARPPSPAPPPTSPRRRPRSWTTPFAAAAHPPGDGRRRPHSLPPAPAHGGRRAAPSTSTSAWRLSMRARTGGCGGRGTPSPAACTR
ncbi:hypothetical protein BU14_2658s0001 [Porphyra umbilicalis]|uniref:Uncharacterized protein n=1 Tax=Porphyra umbilicalis TaxID=2786 RepID=A0A1X6NIY5_PORUM|nr:hypothetical protein BU14_2658s0001 [Porphyra umbilicalis]|eukprot:OSX68512.1 hypothetical protein BU14_2658s0001 [Porphyra umbilicalis]